MQRKASKVTVEFENGEVQVFENVTLDDVVTGKDQTDKSVKYLMVVLSQNKRV